MNKISDERLDKMLTDYCEAPVEPSFSYDPGRASKKEKPQKRYQRQLMAAAVFVLVSVLGLTVYFFIGNKPSVPTAVEPSTQSPTAAYTPTGVGNTQPPGSTAPTEPTQKATQTATQKPTAAPTQRSTQNAAAPTQPGDQGAPAPALQPTDAPPTDAAVTPTQPATIPAAPTQQPTAAPIDPPTEAPPDKPRDLAAVGYDGIIIEKVPKDDIPDDSLICCRIYSEDGEPVGDGDSYSDEHLARRIDRGEEVTVYYIPCDYVVLPYNGVYRYEFYDETGRILCTGSEYLMTESIN